MLSDATLLVSHCGFSVWENCSFYPHETNVLGNRIRNNLLFKVIHSQSVSEYHTDYLGELSVKIWATMNPFHFGSLEDILGTFCKVEDSECFCKTFINNCSQVPKRFFYVPSFLFKSKGREIKNKQTTTTEKQKKEIHFFSSMASITLTVSNTYAAVLETPQRDEWSKGRLKMCISSIN